MSKSSDFGQNCDASHCSYTLVKVKRHKLVEVRGRLIILNWIEKLEIRLEIRMDIIMN